MRQLNVRLCNLQERDQHTTVEESVDGSGTHSQNSSNVGLMSLLPADTVESPKVILSESRYEETMTDGGKQVAGELIIRRKNISRGLRKRTTTQRGRFGRPRSPEIEHQFTGSQKILRRPTVTDGDREVEVGVKSEHIVNSVEY